MDDPAIVRSVVAALALLTLACAGARKLQPSDSPLAAGAHRITVGGVAIAYHVAGAGPVVIAHPGGPGAEWTMLRAPDLEARATVVYIEPVGTGSSGRLADVNGYTIDRYVGDVEALRAHLALSRIVLLGHSHGGFVAQAYALAHPERLRGLILYDTTPTTGPEWQHDVESNLGWFTREPWFADAKAALALETTATTDEEMTAIFRREVPLYFADWTTRHEEFARFQASARFTAAPSRSTTDPSSPSQVGVAPVFDVSDRLHQIAVPTLILVGAKDFVCSEKFARLLHAGIPGSRLVVLARSGHMGHLEEPGAFTGAIASFLETVALRD